MGQGRKEDKGKKIAEPINEEYYSSLKRARFEEGPPISKKEARRQRQSRRKKSLLKNKGIVEPTAEEEEENILVKKSLLKNKGIAEPTTEEENILVKKARVEVPLSIPSCMRGPHIQAYSTGFRSKRGELPDTESLLDRINSIAKQQGLDGVSLEAAEVLNRGLDEYLKRIIRVTMQDSKVDMHMNKQSPEEELGYMSNSKLDRCLDPLSEIFLPGTSVSGTDTDTRADTGSHVLNLTGSHVLALPFPASTSGSHLVNLTGSHVLALPLPASASGSHTVNLTGGCAGTSKRTESITNQMERIGITNQRTITCQNLLTTIRKDPYLLGENWPAKLEKLSSLAFEK